MGVQALGLLARARPARRDGLRHAADALARAIPEGDRDVRLEVLSAREALGFVAGS